jgi:hypothetical protein
MFVRHTFTVPAVVILFAACPTAFAQDDKPTVSLLLSRASAERWDHHILFRCDAVLDNASGKDLTVVSNFFSAFDGLQLVVTTTDGKVLAQKGYIWHQSPASSGREFPLKKGRNEEELRFPIRDLPGDVKTFKVRLVGTLPGSGYDRILSSETLEVKVQPPAK